MQFLPSCKITPLAGPETCIGYNDTQLAVLDMSGFEGVMFVGQIASTGSGNYSLSMTAIGSTLSSFSALKIAGQNATVATTGTNNACALDIHRPATRYVTLELTAASTAMQICVTAYQYGARVLPNPTTYLHQYKSGMATT